MHVLSAHVHDPILGKVVDSMHMSLPIKLPSPWEQGGGYIYSVQVLVLGAHFLFFPARMRRGKMIGRVVVVGTKIAKSGDVRIWASCKHNKYVELGEKLVSVCSESSGTACESYKSCILVGHRSHAH